MFIYKEHVIRFVILIIMIEKKISLAKSVEILILNILENEF